MLLSSHPSWLFFLPSLFFMCTIRFGVFSIHFGVWRYTFQERAATRTCTYPTIRLYNYPTLFSWAAGNTPCGLKLARKLCSIKNTSSQFSVSYVNDRVPDRPSYWQEMLLCASSSASGGPSHSGWHWVTSANLYGIPVGTGSCPWFRVVRGQRG